MKRIHCACNLTVVRSKRNEVKRKTFVSFNKNSLFTGNETKRQNTFLRLGIPTWVGIRNSYLGRNSYPGMAVEHPTGMGPSTSDRDLLLVSRQEPCIATRTESRKITSILENPTRARYSEEFRKGFVGASTVPLVHIPGWDAYPGTRVRSWEHIHRLGIPSSNKTIQSLSAGAFQVAFLRADSEPRGTNQYYSKLMTQLESARSRRRDLLHNCTEAPSAN
eukprot:2029877-Rhodomonas_salina.2